MGKMVYNLFFVACEVKGFISPMQMYSSSKVPHCWFFHTHEIELKSKGNIKVSRCHITVKMQHGISKGNYWIS